MTREKVVTLQIGQFKVYEVVKYCTVCEKIYRHDDLKYLVPEFSNFGYDVIEYVGHALFQKFRTIEQTIEELKEKNVTISEREVTFLGKKFIFYLAYAHKDKSPELRQLLHLIGGYILHFDATCDGDSPHLFCAMAEVVNLVLGSVKMPSETTEAIVAFLSTIKEQYGAPLAGVSDMLKANLAAFEIVFPGIPHFVCLYHFLRDVGKDLMEDDYSILRNGLKRYATCTRLREISKKAKATIGSNEVKYHECIKKFGLSGLSKLPHGLIAYVLTEWIRNYESELDGYGFPFDQGYLVQFQRMKDVYHFLGGMPNNIVEFSELKFFLGSVIEDPEIQKSIQLLQKKTADFTQLRDAMRIALPDGKEGLNDDGEDNADMATIEKAVSNFVEREDIKNSIDLSYQKMYKQIKKYWKKLFADAIIVTLPNGENVRIYVQKTNNLLERFFRELNRGNRKRNGGKSLGRTLQTMLAETPIVKNLGNPEYLRIILNGKSTLAARFAEVDAELIRKEMKKLGEAEDKLPVEVKKLVKIEELPRKLSKAMFISPRKSSDHNSVRATHQNTEKNVEISEEKSTEEMKALPNSMTTRRCSPFRSVFGRFRSAARHPSVTSASHPPPRQ